MSGSFLIKNRQRQLPIDTPRLRRLTAVLLRDLLRLEDFDLSICLVSAAEMSRLNQTYLQHEGPTDVITFDYTDEMFRVGRGKKLKTQNSKPEISLHGEIFICPAEALAQSRPFRTTWQSELARYVIHGILHLRGHDDRKAAARRRMKREENRLLKEIGRRIPLNTLSRR